MKVIISIDDEPLITQLITFQLSKHILHSDILIESINDPEKAMDGVTEMMETGLEVVLLIVDYQMPKINGAQLIQKMKMDFPEIKVIMLSGQANETAVEYLMKENLIEAFIYKPWGEKDLIHIIQNLITFRHDE